ncbi:hypothetical protein ATK74_1660 [Propionicimonas paludicola]|uniref:Uncharacterized protein n=1 Tax=Propionicimonas paludicola TaxID=185243 RepID=A0A2A9CU70_9ACTN|nr:hypothetical protein [Propionicimonas paludicola]PFG17099.1 hypothetical protein ATK74_1660 [Propionicimonas paludicola]
MWVRVMGWMMADDEPPRPSVGSLLRSVGVRARGAVVAADPREPDGIVEVAGGSGPGEQVYAVTGIASEVRDIWSGAERGRRREHCGAEFVLRVGADQFQVQFDGHASEVASGARVTVTGRLELVGEYEWESFQLPDTRTDWLVTEIVELSDDDISARLARPSTE